MAHACSREEPTARRSSMYALASPESSFCTEFYLNTQGRLGLKFGEPTALITTS